jgi:hypothetical protein
MSRPVGREESLNDFGPERLGALLASVDAAWATYDAEFRPKLPLATFSFIASAMHELVAQEIRARLDGRPGVNLIDGAVGAANGRFLVEVDRRYILQVKKLTEDFRTRNNRTDASDDFDSQRSIPTLPDYPRLTLGYKLDDYRTTITGIFVAYNIGDENVWYQDLRTGEYGEGFEALLFPGPAGPSAADQENAEAERKRSKNAGEDDSEGANEGA